jgi:hypothetical protein
VHRTLSLGGILAAVVLILMGLGSIVVGSMGRAEVSDTLKQERITGTPDMTPELTRAAIEEAGLEGVEAPDCSVAGEPIESGADAKCFAEYMRIHALEATGGKTYAEMPRFATEDGSGTNDPDEAQKRPDGSPLDNEARNIWVTETALATALNTSFFAQQVGLFAIVMGIALILVGIGLLVLTRSLRRPEAPGPA